MNGKVLLAFEAHAPAGAAQVHDSEPRRPWELEDGQRAITRDVLERPALVLSCSNRVLTLRRILLGTTGSPLPGGERASGGKPPMPADPTAANRDDRSKLCRTLTASVQANDECGHAVHTRSSTSLSSTHAIRSRANVRRLGRTRNIAPSILLLHIVAEGARS